MTVNFFQKMKNLEDNVDNILQAADNRGVCGKVGTLGSFYSCTSLDDTSPILIATGSELCAAKEQAKQKCANWAVTKVGDCYGGINGGDIYGSYSDSEGSCFEIPSCDDGSGIAIAYCLHASDYVTLTYSQYFIEIENN